MVTQSRHRFRYTCATVTYIHITCFIYFHLFSTSNFLLMRPITCYSSSSHRRQGNRLIINYRHVLLLFVVSQSESNLETISPPANQIYWPFKRAKWIELPCCVRRRHNKHETCPSISLIRRGARALRNRHHPLWNSRTFCTTLQHTFYIKSRMICIYVYV